MVKYGRTIKAPDCLAFARSHVCETGTRKVSAVWGYPATMTFGEAVFAKPLIEAYREMPEFHRPIAYGFETATGGMRKLCNYFSGYRNYAALDFRSFDKTVPAWLVDVAFDILMDNINFHDYQDHGVADVRRMVTMYLYIKRYFLQTVIRISTCYVSSGRRVQYRTFGDLYATVTSLHTCTRNTSRSISC